MVRCPWKIYGRRGREWGAGIWKEELAFSPSHITSLPSASCGYLVPRLQQPSLGMRQMGFLRPFILKPPPPAEITTASIQHFDTVANGMDARHAAKERSGDQAWRRLSSILFVRPRETTQNWLGWNKSSQSESGCRHPGAEQEALHGHV